MVKVSDLLHRSRPSGNRSYLLQNRDRRGRFAVKDEKKCAKANRRDFAKVKSKLIDIKRRTMSVMNGKCEFKITSKQGKPKKSTYDWATQGYVDV